MNAHSLSMVARLGIAADYRDNETGNHIIRMSKNCQLIALAVGLSNDHAEMILKASPMHDVGKIGIPDGILLKPGPLTAEEWEVNKQHVIIGPRIIGNEDDDLLEMCRVIAATHHEKWDGTGYLKGLAGEDIPIEGRIAAIGDVFDALISERPYKKAWDVENAILYINEHSGTHFDPRLVECFNMVLPKILKVRNEHIDKSFHAEPEMR